MSGDGGIPLEQSPAVQESHKDSFPKTFTGSESSLMVGDQSTRSETTKPEEPYSGLKSVLEKQKDKFGRKWVAYLDVDGTALSNDASLLQERIKEGQWGVVYNTGTEIDRIIRLMNENKLPVAQAIACNTGTRRFYLKESALDKIGSEIKPEDFIEDQEYKTRLAATGYDKKQLLQTLQEQMPIINSEFPLFNLRFVSGFYEKGATEWIKEDPFRSQMVFTVPANIASQDLNNYKARISGLFEDNYQVSMGYGDPMENGDAQWNFQLLPKSDICGKDATVRDMMKILGSDTGIIAGDSENDIKALFANYGNEIKDLIRVTVGGSSMGLLNVVDAGDTPESRGSFKRVRVKENEDLRIYKERHGPSRINAASLEHSMKILERAWNIKQKQNNG